MHSYPEHILDQVGLTTLLHAMADRSAGDEARHQLQQLRPIDDIDRISRRIERVDYFMKCLGHTLATSLEPYSWPPDFDRGKGIEGYVFELETMLALSALLRNTKALFDLRRTAEDVHQLSLDIPPLPEVSDLIAMFDKAIDVDGSIRSDATPELAAVHRRMERMSGRIDKVFDQMAAAYGGQGLLSDIKESYRDGRRVLALPAENKRRIQGVLHGASDSGKTVYIEPIQVTEVNNELVELQQERQQLIYALLKEMSARLIMRAQDIDLSRHVVCLCDVALTIARTALDLDWHVPKYDGDASLHLEEMFHPLLQDRLEDRGESVIKNDLILKRNNRVLVVSGPNAGGKSVLLKTAALCQLMYQSGIPIPASADSRLRVFSAIHLDIGDQQSIQDDLSTYSAHLSTMKMMLSSSDDGLLFFIDEMGTGTDPRVGGALAEEMLHRLVSTGSTGVVTTHYPNLKSYADRMKGVVNGSMRFDMDALSPKYQLQVGKPGSSFAFEIARRMGLPEKVLQAAKRKTGTDHFDLEKLLERLETDKDRIAHLEASLVKKQADLDHLMETYISLKKQLDIERRRIKAERKEILSTLKTEQITYFKQLQREIEAADTADKSAAIKKVVTTLDQEQRSVVRDAQLISEEANRLDGTWIEAKDLKVGDHVKLRASDTRGEVVSVKRNKARVSVGGMILEVPIAQLMKIKPPLSMTSYMRVSMDVSKVKVPSRLDLRGTSYTEAEAMLNQYLDDALLAKMSRVEVLHGRGGGVLQKLVRKVGRAHPHVAELVYADEDAGGDAITYITFG